MVYKYFLKQETRYKGGLQSQGDAERHSSDNTKGKKAGRDRISNNQKLFIVGSLKLTNQFENLEVFPPWILSAGDYHGTLELLAQS
jgi:hypothetical protein